ncbi:MAG TPA: hypothetical protein VHC19_02810 [Pirellulales bacterium]|nr:hypothetical protein [Pirellulales bacterium]
MWCSNCRQDVPGVAAGSELSGSEGDLCCIRCGSVVSASSGSSQAAEAVEPLSAEFQDESVELSDFEGLERYDAWELEERLKHVKRLIHGSGETATGGTLSSLRIDAAQPLHPRQIAFAAGDAPPAAAHAGGGWGSFFSWSAITFGLAATTCGGILAVWSYLAPSRQDLREIGLPTLLGGLVVLVIGLLLQLRVAWSSGRSAPAGNALVQQRARSGLEMHSAADRIDSTLSDAF